MPKFGFKHYHLQPLQQDFSAYRQTDPFADNPPKRVLHSGWGVRAVISSHPDGSPVREPKGRGGMTPRGKFPSYKTRRAQPFESLPERRLIHICEADADVVGYFMQPHCLQMRVVGLDKPLTYVPDALRLMANGRVEIVEAKAFPVVDPDYLHKLELAEQVYQERGWSFHIETNRTHFLSKNLFLHAKRITDDRDVLLENADWLSLYQHMEQCAGHSTYGALAKALMRNVDEPAFISRGKIHKMIICRALRIKLDQPVQDQSPLDFLGAESAQQTFALQREWWTSNSNREQAYSTLDEAA